MLIGGFDWDVKRRETNVGFVIVYTFPLSWVYVSAELEGFCVPNLDEVFVSVLDASLSKLISRPSELKQCTALNERDRGLKVINFMYRLLFAQISSPGLKKYSRQNFHVLQNYKSTILILGSESLAFPHSLFFYEHIFS